LPGNARQKARVRELVQLINADVHPLQNTIVRKAISADEQAQRAWCARWIERGLAAYEAQLRSHTGRFSVGDTLTMADLFLVPQVGNAARFAADISAFSRVQAIYAACLATPEAQATRPARAEEMAFAARGAGSLRQPGADG
jgi:maleylacetoacetate isomerase